MTREKYMEFYFDEAEWYLCLSFMEKPKRRIARK